MTTYADTVMHVCMIYLQDQADRDDAFQDTFLKYSQCETVFNDQEHRKAWLIRVASNTCKDMLKRASRRNVDLDAASSIVSNEKSQEETYEQTEQAERVSAALRQLDDRYRIPLYLTYYENMTAAQIADTMEIPENTVYTNLARGRKKLKEVLEHE